MTDEPETPVPTRTHRRVQGRWTVRLAGEPQDRTAVDLGVGGLFVADMTDRTPGTRLDLELEIGDEPLALAAVVRWVRSERFGAGPAGSGLAFEDLSDAARERIVAALPTPEAP